MSVFIALVLFQGLAMCSILQGLCKQLYRHHVIDHVPSHVPRPTSSFVAKTGKAWKHSSRERHQADIERVGPNHK